MLGQDDQHDVVRVVWVETSHDLGRRRGSFPGNSVLELNPLSADLFETRPPRQDGNVLRALRKPRRVETSDVACSVDQKPHATRYHDSKRPETTAALGASSYRQPYDCTVHAPVKMVAKGCFVSLGAELPR